ncbi:glutaredoxin domain-containing protein [Fructobacillus tropaeoli]|uniref:Glutaredoxin (GrxC) n=1 Tax=Fructobacillus tropaeoli TaxID=709323 RepID=A0ABN9YJQ7_9LACO|nr:glutaredoxin domain-containing protein [Fructobacillus tropaeoli]GIC70003.1 NrdH-redoxin [Fructobacillus tropaeoli]CAK1226207.1 Glutaredoxin (GrxC) [Fructobacillus tropaeoli]CAK1227681.1 Glutaredoxin (GrxC) [Fructobacillus tropaeoli]
MLKIYTRKNCAECAATKLYLKTKGVAFEEVSLDQNPELYTHFKNEGKKRTPIVESSVGDWLGFSPKKLNDYIRSEA